MSWRCSGADNLELIRNLCRHRIIKSKAVENAMKAVNRSHYAPKNPFEDAPQSLGYGATISAPHMHAYALEWIHEKLGKSEPLTKRRKVLDVGCGSGYLCACFYHLGYQVRGIDHVKGLVDLSRENLANDGFKKDDKNIGIFLRDGFQGLEEEAPFDAIHVGAAAPTLPEKLVEQLRPGGRMIIPLGVETQKIYAIDKARDGSVKSTPLLGVRYIPLTTPEKQLSGSS
eukprot:g855.t1